MNDKDENGLDTVKMSAAAQKRIEEARAETESLKQDIESWKDRHPILHFFSCKHRGKTVSTLLASLLGGGYLMLPGLKPSAPQPIVPPSVPESHVAVQIEPDDHIIKVLAKLAEMELEIARVRSQEELDFQDIERRINGIEHDQEKAEEGLYRLVQRFNDHQDRPHPPPLKGRR